MTGTQIYENIQRIAWKQGITIQSLCDEAGVRHSVLSDLKCGRNKNITDITLYKLATALDCDIEDFKRIYKEPMPKRPSRRSKLIKEYEEVANAMQDRPELRRLMRVAVKASQKQVESVAALFETVVKGKWNE